MWKCEGTLGDEVSLLWQRGILLALLNATARNRRRHKLISSSSRGEVAASSFDIALALTIPLARLD